MTTVRLPMLVLAAVAVVVSSGCRSTDTPDPSSTSLQAVGWPFDEAEARRRQEETARALGVEIERDIDLGNGVVATMVLIPPGEFLMGSPETEEGRVDDEALHKVVIRKAFYLGKTEVTQEQWRAVMGNNPSTLVGDVLQPVDGVSWNDCRDFLAKAGHGLRLPTEAEWEYACRAGSGAKFSFGDDDDRLDKYAWHYGNSGERTHPVGGKQPNVWGLYDMHGNAWEWCSSSYAEQYDGSETEERAPDATALRCAVRGGSWYWSPMHCRSANRFSQEPWHKLVPFGLRLAQDIDADMQQEPEE